MSSEQIAYASKIANEIEKQSTTNIHLLEERGQLEQTEDYEGGEEDRFSGVIRSPPASDVSSTPGVGGAWGVKGGKGGGGGGVKASPADKDTTWRKEPAKPSPSGTGLTGLPFKTKIIPGGSTKSTGTGLLNQLLPGGAKLDTPGAASRITTSQLPPTPPPGLGSASGATAPPGLSMAAVSPAISVTPAPAGPSAKRSGVVSSQEVDDATAAIQFTDDSPLPPISSPIPTTDPAVATTTATPAKATEGTTTAGAEAAKKPPAKALNPNAKEFSFKFNAAAVEFKPSFAIPAGPAAVPVAPITPTPPSPAPIASPYTAQQSPGGSTAGAGGGGGYNNNNKGPARHRSNSYASSQQQQQPPPMGNMPPAGVPMYGGPQYGNQMPHGGMMTYPDPSQMQGGPQGGGGQEMMPMGEVMHPYPGPMPGQMMMPAGAYGPGPQQGAYYIMPQGMNQPMMMMQQPGGYPGGVQVIYQQPPQMYAPGTAPGMPPQQQQAMMMQHPGYPQQQVQSPNIAQGGPPQMVHMGGQPPLRPQQQMQSPQQQQQYTMVSPDPNNRGIQQLQGPPSGGGAPRASNPNIGYNSDSAPRNTQ